MLVELNQFLLVLAVVSMLASPVLPIVFVLSVIYRLHAKCKDPGVDLRELWTWVTEPCYTARARPEGG